MLLQRLWRKKRYQYLQYFMLPKHLRFEPEPEFNTGLGGLQRFTYLEYFSDN